MCHKGMQLAREDGEGFAAFVHYLTKRYFPREVHDHVNVEWSSYKTPLIEPSPHTHTHLLLFLETFSMGERSSSRLSLEDKFAWEK